MSQLFLEGLDESRQQVFYALKPFSDRFILAGGTAIMLQIGHRVSYDFDLFTENPFPKNLKTKFNKIFDVKKPRLETNEIMLFQTKNMIDIHLVVETHKNLKQPIKTKTVFLNHLDDLAANKTFTISQRAAWRDYIDLFFLLKWNLYTIGKLIDLSRKKFGFEFNERLFSEQLVFFKDIVITPVTFLKEKYTTNEIQTFLQSSVKEYLQQKKW